MAGPAEICRDIHRLRRFLDDLQEQMDRVPRQVRAQQARVKKQEEQLHQAHELIKRLKIDAHSKEVTLRTTHEQIAKYERQMDSASSKKEYDAFKHEIAQARARCQQIEDEILTCISEGEEKTAQLPEQEKGLQQVREEYARFEQTSNERLAELKRQQAEAQEQLQAAEAQLPASVVPAYRRLLTARGTDALAPVRGRTCSACYTEVTAQTYHELQQNLFVLCKSCGRVMYLPEQG